MSMPCMPCHGTIFFQNSELAGREISPGISRPRKLPICLSGFEGRYCGFEASGRSVDLKSTFQRHWHVAGASFLVSVTFWLESHKGLEILGRFRGVLLDSHIGELPELATLPDTNVQRSTSTRSPMV
jgi:hypothetical protein